MAKKSSSTGSIASSQTKVRSDGDGNAIKNEILLGLPRKECDFIFSKLTLVDLGVRPRIAF
jgi:hypothetical protein